jgi:hypothetical protein
MAIKWAAKDPDERLDYEHDWTAVLEDGDTIDGLPEALVDVGDVVVDSSTVNGNVQKVWLSGGTAKKVPEHLTLRINTTGGRIFDEGVNIQIKGR